ncbi:MAG: DMT family transporter [Flavobacteriales bacterium]|nr:DMT family transporter [Flavobacteriales bacterium]
MTPAYRNALLLLHFTVFLWGWTGIFGKLIEQDTAHLVFSRTFIALGGLAVFALATKRTLDPRTPDLVNYLLMGVLIAVHWLTFYGSIKVSTASIGAACLATSTMFTALLEPFWFKRRIRMYEVVLGAVVIGALLLMFGLETQYRLGIALGVVSALFSAWFNIVNGVLVRRGEAVRIGFYELLCVMLCAAIWLFISGETPQLPWMLSINDLRYQLVLGLVCTTFAFVTGIAVMKQLSPFTVVLAVNLEPVYTIAIALLIWGEGERMHAGSYAGIALILICLFANGMFQRHERRKQEATTIAPIV